MAIEVNRVVTLELQILVQIGPNLRLFVKSFPGVMEVQKNHIAESRVRISL